MRITLSHLISGILIFLLLAQCRESDNITSDTEPKLSKPELIFPEHNSEQPTSLTFQWQEIEGALSYQIQISQKDDFSQTLVDDVTDTTAFHVEGLPEETTIHWRVRSLTQFQTGPWSDIFIFTTLAGSGSSQPESTTLTSPADNTRQPGQDVTLKWATVVNAKAYEVQLSLGQNFTSFVVNEQIDSTSYKVSDLPSGQTFYWRVQPVIEQAETQWSDVFTFYTKDANDAPDPGSSEVRIMPLGNSITEAFGYRIPLWNKLTGEEYKINYVGSQSEPHPDLPDPDHEGHGGWTIGNVAEHVNEWLEAHNPEYILLMIGTNDVAWWSARNGAEIADAHARLVDQIIDNTPADTQVLVASIPPQSSKNIEPNNVDRAQLARDFNAEMEKRMKQRIMAGKPIAFVDIHSQLTVDHLSDGVHPNKEGYEIIAQTWFEALLAMLP